MTEFYKNAIDFLGTSGDADAVQDTFDAVHADGGGTVIIPPKAGDWTFNKTVRYYGNTRVLGQGKIRCDSSGLPLFYNYDKNAPQPSGYSGQGDVIFEGLTFDMHAQDNPVEHNIMTFAHAEGLTVRDCKFMNASGYHPIEPHAAKNVTIDNCRFLGYKQGDASFPREAIQIDCIGLDGDDDTACQDINVINCYEGASDECGAFGRLVGSHTVGSTYHSRITIKNCTINDCLDDGIHPRAWMNVVIEDNQILGANNNGIGIYADNFKTSGMIIANNLIRTVGNYSIYIHSTDGTDWPGINIVGNIMTNPGVGYIKSDVATDPSEFGNRPV